MGGRGLGDRHLLADQLQPDLVLLRRGQEPLRAPAGTVGPTVGFGHDRILQQHVGEPVGCCLIDTPICVTKSGANQHRGQWKAVGRRDTSRGRPCYARFIERSWSQTAAVVPPTVRDSSRLPTQLFPDPAFALPRWLDVAKDVLST